MTDDSRTLSPLPRRTSAPGPISPLNVAAASDPAKVKPIYVREQSLADKITTVATKVYGAAKVSFKPAAKSRLEKFEALGYGSLPVCIAKTHLSLSDDEKLLGRPRDFEMTVREVRIAAGAGFLVPLTGDVLTMPGLPRHPQAMDIDLQPDGTNVGLQ